METSLLQQILLIVVLIGMNAFFSATEIAVITLNMSKLRRQAQEGDKSAARIVAMVEKPAKFLSSIQIGITLAGFLASAFAADNFADPLVIWIIEEQGFTALSAGVLNTVSVIFITLILSYFTLVLGELVPKRIAMQKPESIARVASFVIPVITTVFGPIIWFLSASTNAILKLLRMRIEAEEDQVTEEEIRLMIDIGEEKGTIETKERELIENIFELNDTMAKDIMTHRMLVEAIDIHAEPQDIFKQISESGWSRFPVYEGNIGNIVGILIAKEFLISYKKEQMQLEKLVRSAYFVPETVRADALFYDMQKKKYHIAVVVDEYGETSGIITMEDLLEEIVGNIYDESDEAEDLEIVKVEDNWWRVAGSVEIPQLEKALEISLPEDRDYQTLGGLVIAQMDTIPEDGAQFDVAVYGLKIHVEDFFEKRVEWAYIRKEMP